MDKERLLELLELAQASGKVKKGVNEVTKFLERGTAKLVIAASDSSPKEIIMHLPLLAKEKGIAYAEVPSREELGAAAGIGRPTAAIAIVDAGSAKDLLKAVIGELGVSENESEEPAEEKEEVTEESSEEPAKEASEDEEKKE